MREKDKVSFTDLKQQTPYAQHETVDITFGAAHTDVEIRHHLKPPTPEHIDYLVLRQTQAGVIYHDNSANRKPWIEGVIRLRSNVANSRVTLLLTVSHDKRELNRDTVTAVDAEPADHTHDAGDVVSGTFDVARIPNLDAAKITSGAFDATRIPNLDASKITTGTLGDARLSSNIPLLDASDTFELNLTVQGEFHPEGKIHWGTKVTYLLPGSNVLSDAVSAMSDGDVIILGPGNFTQSVAVHIPNTVNHFSIIGQGAKVTKITYSENTHGIYSDVGSSDNYRIKAGHLRGFSMVYDNSSAGTGDAILLWGHSYGAIADPTITIEDIHIIYGANGKCWVKGIHLVNEMSGRINGCYIRMGGSTYVGDGIVLDSCMNIRISNCFIMSCNYGIAMHKAADDNIYGSVKHGCEDIQVSATTIFIVNYGVLLGYMCFINKFVNVEVCRPVYAAWFEDISLGANNGGYHLLDQCYVDNDSNHQEGGAFLYFQRPGNIVRGCHLINTGARTINGIVITTDASGCTIANNILRGMGYGGSSAILVYGDQCTITGNMFENTSTAGYDVNIQASAANCMLVVNQFDIGYTGSPDANSGHNTTH